MPKLLFRTAIAVGSVLVILALVFTLARNRKLVQERKALILKNDSLHIQQLETRVKLVGANKKIDSLLTYKRSPIKFNHD
ncbi:MAG: hypothetical protein JNM68_10620 [Dinghuibacter sp.]|nr:hypothetical protein [Dinghuibacter sp.]